MTLLTLARHSEQYPPVTEKNVTGIGSPEWSGDKPHSASNAAFLSPWHPQFWAAGREEQQCSPVLHRYFRLPFGLPSQSEVWMAVTHRNWSIAMQTQSQGAPAPIVTKTHPFVRANAAGEMLLSVRAGVPAVDALEMASCYLAAARDAAFQMALDLSDAGLNDGIWPAYYLIEMAKAALDASISVVADEGASHE